MTFYQLGGLFGIKEMMNGQDVNHTLYGIICVEGMSKVEIIRFWENDFKYFMEDTSCNGNVH